MNNLSDTQLKSLFLENFRITHDKNDFVRFKDLDKFIEIHEIKLDYILGLMNHDMDDIDQFRDRVWGMVLVPSPLNNIDVYQMNINSILHRNSENLKKRKISNSSKRAKKIQRKEIIHLDGIEEEVEEEEEEKGEEKVEVVDLWEDDLVVVGPDDLEATIAFLTGMDHLAKSSLVSNISKIKNVFNCFSEILSLKSIIEREDFIDRINAFEFREHKKPNNYVKFSEASKQKFIEVILLLCNNRDRNVKSFINVAPEVVSRLIKYKDIYTLKKTEVTSLVKKIPIMKWSDYLAFVKNHPLHQNNYEESKLNLILSMYNEFTRRDDFSLIIIDKEEDNVSKEINYLLINERCKAIINQHKTQGNDIVAPVLEFSEKVSDLLKKYIEKNNLKAGDYLFNSRGNSIFISDCNKAMGITHPFGCGINLLRDMKASEENHLHGNDAEHMVVLAQSMGHSVMTQQRTYVQPVIEI